MGCAFEHGYGMSRKLQRRIIRRDALKNCKLLRAGDFGSGANMAFRRNIFAAIGPFDVTLGVDTPSGGGG